MKFDQILKVKYFLPLANALQCVLPVDSFTQSAYATFEDSTNYVKSFGR
jgi:hypothetical protein